MNTPEIETERLVLRKFTEDDFGDLYEIYSDVDVNEFLPWFPLRSVGEAKIFFEERYAGAYARDCGYQYAVCLKEDNVPVGYVNVSMEDGHDFGYGLRKEFWHRGIVSEAGKAVGMRYKYSYEELWQPKNFWVVFRMYQLNFDGNNDRVYKEYWDKYENHFIESL